MTKDYNVNYSGDSAGNRLVIGEKLYSGDKIIQVYNEGSGGIRIIYHDSSNQVKKTSNDAKWMTDYGNDALRTITIDAPLGGYQAWELKSVDCINQSVDQEHNKDYNLNLFPYGLIDNNSKEEQPKEEQPKEEQPTVYVDHDTYKTCLSPGTAMYYNNLTSTIGTDMKVHETDEKNAANQVLLANAYMQSLGRNGAKIVSTYDIFSNRTLSSTENGSKQVLKWTNTKLPAGTVVYAICYNQTDGVYYLSGVVDKDGTVIFENFILREATTISIVTGY